MAHENPDIDRWQRAHERLGRPVTPDDFNTAAPVSPAPEPASEPESTPESAPKRRGRPPKVKDES